MTVDTAGKPGAALTTQTAGRPDGRSATITEKNLLLQDFPRTGRRFKFADLTVDERANVLAASESTVLFRIIRVLSRQAAEKGTNRDRITVGNGEFRRFRIEL